MAPEASAARRRFGLGPGRVGRRLPRFGGVGVEGFHQARELLLQLAADAVEHTAHKRLNRIVGHALNIGSWGRGLVFDYRGRDPSKSRQLSHT
jgi:hypothetical protein